MDLSYTQNIPKNINQKQAVPTGKFYKKTHFWGTYWPVFQKLVKGNLRSTSFEYSGSNS